MSSKINCIALTEHEIKFDDKQRLWPCCYYAANFGKHGVTGDVYIDSLDPTWNSLKHHKMTDILNHPAFTEHWQPDNWASDCPTVCMENCRSDIEIVRKENVTGNTKVQKRK